MDVRPHDTRERGMVDFVAGFMDRLGLVGVGLLMLLENVFPPIPSEVIMPLAGFVARKGRNDIVLTIVAGSIGSLLGAFGWYWVGRKVGEERLRAWVDRHGRWLALSGDDIDRAGDWFRRHRGVAVGVGRLVPGVRTLISLPAGFARMPLLPFALWSTIGTVAWTAALVLAGYLLGAAYDKVQGPLNVATWIVFGAILAMYLWRVFRHNPKAKGRREKRSSSRAPSRRAS
jgi:membrane protein DedA with SNARE-associated domain